MHQYATLAEAVYFLFGVNDTVGDGADGASSAFDVRECGAAASAAPLVSGSATLLTHANYPPGCYEIAIDATAGNGFAANKTYGVFCTLLVDSRNPTGFVGSFRLSGVPAKLTADALGNLILADPGTTKPTWASDLAKHFAYWAAWSLNEVNSTAAAAILRNSDDSADLASHIHTDDGTTFTSGPAS